MSIDIVVTENSELSEVAAAPQEGVRDLPAQRGPYLVEERDDETRHGEAQLTVSGCTARPYKVCHCFVILSAFP